MAKPRTRFCWECGNQLWGNHFEELEVDQHPRILHKECADRIKKNKREEWYQAEEQHREDKPAGTLKEKP
jgi:hypothetical protein